MRYEEEERHKLGAMEMKCQSSLCGVTRMDRWRNEVVRHRAGARAKMSDRVGQKILMWFGHVLHLSDERMTKRVYDS